jgi:putative restriction endonuclease
MAVRDLPRKLTYEDYLLFPEDGQRHEILDGEHYVTPSPFFQHQFTAGRLYLRLGNFVEARDLGIVLFAPSMSSSRRMTSCSPIFSSFPNG